MEQIEFFENYGSDEKCATYLFGLRWNEGLRCPNCNFDKMYLSDRCLVKCNSCNYSFPITAGTPLHFTTSKLQSCFQAIWYASTVQHPGKITIQKYQEILRTKNNRFAINIKNLINNALKNRIELIQLAGEVEVSVRSVTIQNVTLTFAIAGEVQNRKVLRFWARLYSNPENVYPFIKKYVSNEAILSFSSGRINNEQLKSMGYEVKVHRGNYDCRAVYNFSTGLINQLKGEAKLSEANKKLEYFCALSNSAYTPISYDDLLEAIFEKQNLLPPFKGYKK